MLKVNLENEIKRLKKDLSRVEKKAVPNAAILSINDTLKLVKAGQQLQMKRKLENPTNFTLNSLKIFEANKKTRSPKGRIFIFRRQEEYIKYQIDGGVSRSVKGGFPVPVDRSLKNRFGNLRRGKTRLFRTKKDFYADVEYFELYNLEEDPFEINNLVGQNKEKATSLKTEMDAFISELTSSPNLVNPPRIAIGTPYENPVYLNRNDAGGQRGVWNQEEIFSYWKVDLEKGVYDFKFKFLKPLDGSGEMFLELGQSILKKYNPSPNLDQLVWKGVSLPKGTFDLIPFYRKQRGSNFFPLWVEIKKVE